jgi:hypothetical protein
MVTKRPQEDAYVGTSFTFFEARGVGSSYY